MPAPRIPFDTDGTLSDWFSDSDPSTPYVPVISWDDLAAAVDIDTLLTEMLVGMCLEDEDGEPINLTPALFAGSADILDEDHADVTLHDHLTVLGRDAFAGNYPGTYYPQKTLPSELFHAKYRGALPSSGLVTVQGFREPLIEDTWIVVVHDENANILCWDAGSGVLF